jgi:hypothetical protein
MGAAANHCAATISKKPFCQKMKAIIFSGRPGYMEARGTQKGGKNK